MISKLFNKKLQPKETIDERLIGINYPVGLHIQYNLQIIKGYTEVITEILEKYEIEKDIVLFCTGSSGAIIASIIVQNLITSDALGRRDIKVYHIKKEGEKSHHNVRDIFHTNRYNIIVDDFVSSGESIRRILNAYKDCVFDLLVVSNIYSKELVESLGKQIRNICYGAIY